VQPQGDHSHFRFRLALVEGGSALLGAAVLCSALRWKRIREVEAEIVTAPEPALHSIADTVDGDSTPAEQPLVSAEPASLFSAVPEPVDEGRTEEESPAEIPEPDEGSASPALVEAVAPVAEPTFAAVPEPVDDERPKKEPAQAERAHAAPSPSSPSRPPAVSLDRWMCEIAIWSARDEAVFYARSFHDGEEITIAESTRFPSGGGGTVEPTGAAAEAHERLCDELAAAGWQHVGRGVEWYGDRFRREFSIAALNASLTTRVFFARRP
jgi:hypothetical protein